jgi:BlaI family penicillinase repressor
LVEKGVVHRTSTRPAQYSAAVTPAQVRERDLETLVDRVSSGRVVPLVAHLIDRRDITCEEIAELKQLIAEAEERVGKAKGGKR